MRLLFTCLEHEKETKSPDLHFHPCNFDLVTAETAIMKNLVAKYCIKCGCASQKQWFILVWQIKKTTTLHSNLSERAGLAWTSQVLTLTWRRLCTNTHNRKWMSHHICNGFWERLPLRNCCWHHFPLSCNPTHSRLFLHNCIFFF